MTTENNNKELSGKESCSCSDPSCCQPRSRNRWQNIVFFAVVILAAGIIAFRLLNPAKPASGCNSKGCCSDTTQCTDKK
ncbi:MAG: hypothetical protein NTU44_08475 [Bacteroidetes bacterium]|nr:hypothetical protein [Bacteroidota bacterium]